MTPRPAPWCRRGESERGRDGNTPMTTVRKPFAVPHRVPLSLSHQPVWTLLPSHCRREAERLLREADGTRRSGLRQLLVLHEQRAGVHVMLRLRGRRRHQQVRRPNRLITWLRVIQSSSEHTQGFRNVSGFALMRIWWRLSSIMWCSLCVCVPGV